MNFFYFIILFFFVLMFQSCNKKDETIVLKSPNQNDSLAYSQYDTDNDGLADKYEVMFGLKVGVQDANKEELDPLWKYQWHLKNNAFAPDVNHNILKIAEDINISPVWRYTLGEKSIALSVVDTGIESKHEDIDVDMKRSYRYSDGSFDPSPTDNQLYDDDEGSAHGTACAGIIAAKGWNKKGVRGVAPNISLVGLNVFSKPSDASFISALQKEGIDVSSNSWGGSGAQWLHDDRVSLEAIENGITNGRGKKGVSYIFAAGNDSANANFQSILTSTYVIAVSAVDGAGRLEEYSDFGSNILISSPGGSSDAYMYPAIVTTDLSGLNIGMDTYNTHWNVVDNGRGDYTNTMNGTSAACPIVAGVVSLMLTMNPNLTYRDVQYIVATTARKNDSDDPSWKQNSAGFFISNKYGFGVIDAGKAVQKAKTFVSLGEEKIVEQTFDVNLSLATGNEIVLEAFVTEDFKVTNVQLRLKTDHDNNGKLKIILESPKATQSILAYGDTVLYNKYEPWTFLSVAFLEESSRGRWLVHIQDMGSENRGDLSQWSLIVRGYE